MWLAEARIGAELKSAQERIEVTEHGNPSLSNTRGSANRPATPSEMGIPSQHASEFKKLTEAGEERIREEAVKATCARLRARKGYCS
ncbi:hypothetical protein [Muricoccus radiodurans]|uniref:hypothetical protein n=1 Tax=Muricoccus radiodurans TaxID=2231721 RepID=UPI003CEE7EC1